MAERFGERRWGPERGRYDAERERYRDDYSDYGGGRRPGGEGYGARSWAREEYEPEYGPEGWDPGYRSVERDPGGARRWRRSRDDRGFLDRAGDEVRAWFGDDEARRRRMMDEREVGYDERGGRGRGDQWGFGPWPGGRQLQEEWRQWGVEPYARRGYGHGGRGRGWTEWGDFGAWFGGESGRERRGPFAGRGPRGYQRSDERIKDDVCEQMAQHGDLDASAIEVRVENGEVTLQGSVDSRRAKHLAEDLVEDVFGVREVHNLLRVATGTQDAPRGGQDERRVA
jgi:osmotically-inducible protein OsmY